MQIARIAVGLMVLLFGQAMAYDLLGDLRKYEHADPGQELKKAISRHDLRFMATGDLVPTVPVIDNFEARYQKYGMHIIRGFTCMSASYEHSRLEVIANHFARNYNANLKRYVDGLEGEALSKQMPGYEETVSRFKIDVIGAGDFLALQYSFVATLSAKGRQCVTEALWSNPIEKDKALYDWNQFLRAYAEVDEVVCSHPWIQEWIDAGKERSAAAQIFGIRPYTETNLQAAVLPAWKHAGLAGEPWYEVALFEGQHSAGTVYIGKDRVMALVLESDAQKSAHWLDRIHFKYRPEAADEYIVVNRNGEWRRGAESVKPQGQ